MILKEKKRVIIIMKKLEEDKKRYNALKDMRKTKNI